MATADDIEKVTEALEYLENYLGSNDEAQAARRVARAAIARLEAEHKRLQRAAAAALAAGVMSPEADNLQAALNGHDGTPDGALARALADNATLLQGLKLAVTEYASGREAKAMEVMDVLVEAEHPGRELLEENKRLRADSERLKEMQKAIRRHWAGDCDCVDDHACMWRILQFAPEPKP